MTTAAPKKKFPVLAIVFAALYTLPFGIEFISDVFRLLSNLRYLDGFDGFLYAINTVLTGGLPLLLIFVLIAFLFLRNQPLVFVGITAFFGYLILRNVSYLFTGYNLPFYPFLGIVGIFFYAFTVAAFAVLTFSKKKETAPPLVFCILPLLLLGLHEAVTFISTCVYLFRFLELGLLSDFFRILCSSTTSQLPFLGFTFFTALWVRNPYPKEAVAATETPDSRMIVTEEISEPTAEEVLEPVTEEVPAILAEETPAPVIEGADTQAASAEMPAKEPAPAALPRDEAERIALLREYKALLDSGILTQAEFDQKKQELLK